MKKLPEIYKNQINKSFRNNKSVYYSNEKTPENIKKNLTVKEVLKSLKREKGYIFNKPVLIKTKDKTIDTAIIYINENSIITLNEDTIKIEDILSITRK